MSKKRIISIVLFLGVAIGFIMCIKKYNEITKQKEHETVMQESIKEAKYINENSDLYGLYLLDVVPDGFNPTFNNVIHNGQKNVESYYCWEFEGKERVTQICLRSAGGNIFDIHVGDYYEKAVKIMEEKGYKLERIKEGDISDWTKYSFDKAYVTIAFDITLENIIKKITIGIDDPTLPIIIY